jgi:O-antigen ligase
VTHNLLENRIHPDRKVSAILVLALFVVTLLGRFTLDRVGVEQYGDLDLRVVAVGGLLLVTLLWRLLPGPCHYRHRWSPSAQLTLVLIGYLAVTVFWSPPGARITQSILDLVYLALLVALTVTISAPDPSRARRIIIISMLTAGVIYALAGLLIGQTDQQGRTIAFGGGPNVYVRVIVLGVIASIALTIIYQRKLFLLTIPALVAAGVLSGSRGGTLAALATGLATAVLRWRRLSWRSLLAAMVVSGAAVIGCTYLLEPREIWALQQRFISDIFVQDQFSGRPELFNEGLSIAFGHPLAGGGLDSFYAWFGRSEDLGYPHNLLVDVAATGGLIGLGLFVAVVVAFVRDGRPWRSMPADQMALIAAAFYVALASMFSGDIYDSRFVWIFVAMAMNNSAASRCPGGGCLTQAGHIPDRPNVAKP